MDPSLATLIIGCVAMLHRFGQSVANVVVGEAVDQGSASDHVICSGISNPTAETTKVTVAEACALINSDGSIDGKNDRLAFVLPEELS